MEQIQGRSTSIQTVGTPTTQPTSLQSVPQTVVFHPDQPQQTAVQSTPTPPPAPSPAPTPASPPLPPSTPTPPLPQPQPHPKRAWKPIIKRIAIVTAILLVLTGIGFVAFRIQQDTQANNQRQEEQVNPASRYGTLQLPLGELAEVGGLTIEGNRTLSINGQLRVNNSLVLSPTGQPTNAVAGQLYYDQGDNLLSYYNGSRFVDVLGSENAVLNLGGLNGSINLGGGLTATAGTLTNSGVLSLQGQTGDIVLTSGGGIAIDGTTLTNTGLLSIGGQAGAIELGAGLSITGSTLSNSGILDVVAGTPNLVVSKTDGTVTISDVGGGSGTVSSPGGTAGRIAKFTGVQTIADSLLSESGTTVTVTGDLSVTGSLTLGVDLGVTQGGTGTSSLTTNGVVVGQGTGALISVAAGAPGQCLISTAGAPSFQACPGSGGVTSLNGLTGAISVANASAAGSTITINDASTSGKGIAQFNGTNFSVAGGVVNTIQDISVTATPTFGQLTLTGDLAVNGGDITSTGALNITPGGTLTMGAINQQALLQGNANTQITATGGGFTTTLGFAGVASGNVVYNFDRSVTAGNYTVCSTAGNCAGVGGGVTTAGGTTNRLSKFTSAQGIGDSTISDDGTTVTTSVDMAIQGGDVTIGVASTQTGSLRFAHSGSAFFGTITQGALTANRTYVLPDASGTICLTSGNCSGSGSANTLQAAYDAGNTITTTDGRNIVFTLSDLTTDPSFLVNLECDTACSTNGRFAIQTDGVDVFTVSPTTGGVTFQNSTNSATAFQVKNASGANTFTIDTSATTFLFGEDTTNKHVQIDLSGNDGIVDIGATGGNLHFVLRQLSNGAAKINTDSDLIMQRTSNSLSAFQVQNAAGTVAALSVDTTNILTRISGAGSDASASSGTGAVQIGSDAGLNLAFDDNEIVARNNGSMSTLFLQNGGGGVSVGANLVNFQNATNSNNSFTVRNAAGTSVATIDTTDGELELGSGSTLNGVALFRNSTNNFVQVLTATAATANRTISLPDETGTICLRNSTSCGFAASSGSGNYINNTATLQQNANIAIESANDASRTMYLRNRATQSADIMRVEQNNGAHVFSIDTFGSLRQSGQTNLEGYTGIGIPSAATTGVALRIYSPTASDIGLQVNAQGSQTADVLQLNGINSRTLKYDAAGTLQVTGGAVQSANLFEVRDNSSNMLASFGPTGSIVFQNATDSANAFRVNNAVGGYVFNVDTANSEVDIGFLEVEIYNGTGGSIDTFFTNADIGIGTARADTIDIGRSGATTSIIGNLVQNSGTIAMTANGASSITTTAGALTLQSVNASNNIILNGGSNAMTLNTGTAGTITMGSSTTSTINVGALTNDARTVNVGTGTGGSQTQTVNIGSQGGASTTLIQGGNSASAIALTTATNGSITATTTGTGSINLNTANGLRVKTTTDSTTGVNVKTSLDNNMFTIDTVNSRIGVNLSGNTVPSLAGAGLEMKGALKLSGANGTFADNYITPLGASVQSAINIVNYDPGAAAQLVAMGLPSTANATSRALTLLDARAGAHQPTLALLSPDENQYMGMSWEGTNTAAFLKASANRNWVIRSDTTDLAVFEASTQQNGVGVSDPSAAWQVSSTINGNSLLKITDGATNVVHIADEGAANFQNSTNSANAFKVQNAGGNDLFRVDSTDSRVFIGSSTADSTGILLVLDGKNTAGDPTGIDGGMYYNENLSAFRCYEAGAWKNCSDPRSMNWGYRLEEDFLSEADSSWEIGTHGWSDSINGAGTYSGKVAADSYLRPGQHRLGTGTTAAGFADVFLGGKWDTNEQFILGGGEVIEFSINLENLSTASEEYVARVGMCDEDGAADCIDGVYFEYDRTQSANWRIATANNNTRTKTNSSKAVATGWVNFRILVSGSGTATSAQYFVRNNGETTWTSLGTVNTNLPGNTRGTAPSFDMTKTAGTTNRNMLVDYFNMYNSFGGAGR